MRWLWRFLYTCAMTQVTLFHPHPGLTCAVTGWL
nr:MAG TPA: hypothetical protein [Caudoviricetes sp.]